MNDSHSDVFRERLRAEAAMERQLQSIHDIETTLRRSRPVEPSLSFEAIERAIADRDAGARASALEVGELRVVERNAKAAPLGPGRKFAIIGSWCFGATAGAAAAVVVMLLVRPPAASDKSSVAVGPVAGNAFGVSEPVSVESKDGSGVLHDHEPVKSDGKPDARRFASDRFLMQIVDDPRYARTGEWRTLLAIHRRMPAESELDSKVGRQAEARKVRSFPTRAPVEFDTGSLSDTSTPTRQQLWQELLDDPELLL